MAGGYSLRWYVFDAITVVPYALAILRHLRFNETVHIKVHFKNLCFYRYIRVWRADFQITGLKLMQRHKLISELLHDAVFSGRLFFILYNYTYFMIAMLPYRKV